MPAVIRLGYGVHGNEPSAHNAAPLVAYYLAAGQSEKVKEILDNLVIVIDPSLNPDGQDRFASWVNRYKSRTLNPDPVNIEFNDVWPGPAPITTGLTLTGTGCRCSILKAGAG
jgi:hypothetical protein